MKVENAVMPEREKILELLSSGHEGTVSMVNLLKFREKAAYPDGSDAELSGREAYSRYGQKMVQIVTANGGKLIYGGAIQDMVIGDVEQLWDNFALVEYPSLSEFIRITSLPEVAEIASHRVAGLAGQLLIMVSLEGEGVSTLG